MTTSAKSGERAPETNDVDQDDAPVDDRKVRGRVAKLFDLPMSAFSALRRSASATPGRLVLIAIGLALSCLVAGQFGTVTAEDRQVTITGLIDRREPLAAAAQQVYRALSDADATSASSFLVVGSEPVALRQRYERDVAEAGAALAKAASGSADNDEAARQVDILGQRLPVYTGLIESARLYNRQGFPVGASYLREASELMRAELLPAARELYRVDTERLAAEQDATTDIPWATTFVVLTLLGALVCTQRYLTRKTNRLLNVGLVVATLSVVVGLLWAGVALLVQSTLIDSAKDDGSRQVDVLVRARIGALQARADETLTLIARGDGAAYDRHFAETAERFAGTDGRGGLLAEARALAAESPAVAHVDAAIEAASAWFRAHAQVRRLDDEGRYQEAVDTAILEGREDGAAVAFSRVDDGLRAAITAGRQKFLDDTRNAERALTLLPWGMAGLALIAAIAAVAGIHERLKEYQ
ncbi:hypothetical protein [Amycolatopsis thailandensis]|uniref:hypothetical protein n=1 Tax=Amycolatopsis thailandensis TaxID=589330 RepID=UPI0036405D30